VRFEVGRGSAAGVPEVVALMVGLVWWVGVWGGVCVG
jgi:hypothetical protein